MHGDAHAWRAPGSQSNGLRASAPIWTPKQKSGGGGGFHKPPVSAVSPNGFSVNSSETMFIPGYNNNASNHQHHQKMSGGWSNHSWSGSVSPMSHPMQSSPMPMMQMPNNNGVAVGAAGGIHGSPLGSSPSSPGTGVFLPSSLGSSRRPSYGQGGSGSGSGSGVSGSSFLHGASPPRRFNINSTSSSHNTAISLPDELF